MALVSLNLKPSIKQLHSFRFVFPFMCMVLGFVLYKLNAISFKGFLIFLLGCLVFYCLSLVSTRIFKSIYLATVIVTFPMAWFISYLAMASFYFWIITPISVIFRIVGRDALCRRYDKQAKTYWIAHKDKKSAEEYFHPF